jgi:hypothetical protein
MRYLLVTYLRKPGGQIDEQVGVDRKLRVKDIQSCSVIIDYQDLKVIKCVIEGEVRNHDFGYLHEYYKKVYPNLIESMEKVYGLTRIDEPIEQQPEENKDGQ